MNLLKKGLLLLLVCALSSTVSAQQFYYEGIIFEVLTEEPTAVRVYQVNRCMKSFEIPNTVADYSGKTYDVTRIGSDGFRRACTLVDIHFGPVEQIEDGYMNYYDDGAMDCHGGFFGCADLSQVTMPQITSIGDYAFYECPKLSRLIMGVNLQKIGEKAFGGCPSISVLQIHAPQPPICAPDAFMDPIYEKAVLQVPYGKKAIYQQADVWKRFKRIEEMSESTGLESMTHDVQSVRIMPHADVISIEGLVCGETVGLYALDGRLLRKQVARNDKMQIKVENGRTYLLKVGKTACKIKM